MINLFIPSQEKYAELILITNNKCLVICDNEAELYPLSDIVFAQSKEELVTEIKSLLSCVARYDLRASKNEVNFIITELETALTIMRHINLEVDKERFTKLIEGVDIDNNT